MLLLDAIAEKRIREAQARGEFSADQMAVYEEQLAKAEAALRAFQESQIGLHVTSTVVNDQNLDQARGILHDTDSEVDQIRERIAAELKQWQDGGGASSGPPDLTNSTTSELESRLASLEPSLAIASLEGDKGAAEAATLKMKIGANRQALYAEYQSQAAAVRDIPSENARDAASGIALDRSILRSLREKRQRLGVQVSSYLHRVESEPRNKMQLDRLQQDVTTSRDLLNALRREATSSRISEALETSQRA